MTLPITSSSSTSDIRQLQQLLTDRGFPVAVDGILGPQTLAAVREFQTASGLAADGIAGPNTWAALNAAPTPVEPPSTGPFTGFDTSFYPGDSAMQTWKDSSPYHFVGYYLKSPCHGDSGWMGKRATLSGQGWGVVVIYVGMQSQGPCSSKTPTRELGESHGRDALAKAASEGFAAQTIVYLDVEPMDQIPQAQIDYVNGWLSQFSGAGFVPGIYCHVKNAQALRAAITDFAADQIAFWVSGGRGFIPGTSRPAHSGIAFARVWQGSFNLTREFGGVSIEIDENVSDELLLT